jgi:hypothetical protein
MQNTMNHSNELLLYLLECVAVCVVWRGLHIFGQLGLQGGSRGRGDEQGTSLVHKLELVGAPTSRQDTLSSCRAVGVNITSPMYVTEIYIEKTRRISWSSREQLRQGSLRSLLLPSLEYAWMEGSPQAHTQLIISF